MINPPQSAQKWRSLAIISVAELLAMTLWFSATAVAPELTTAWHLTPGEAAWLTISVQVGFVVGALGSAAVTLSDVIRPRHLFAVAAVCGALATAAIPLLVHSLAPAIVLRFATGVALAGVYPPGMKMMAGWFRSGRGFAIGVMVGSLTIGSAFPHLIRAYGGIGHPAPVLFGATAFALLAAVLILFVREGPYQSPPAPFDPSVIGRILRDRPTMLANGGYFGHMWELYAVWTWIPAYLAASFAISRSGSEALVSTVAFATIAVGGFGAVTAGFAADRWGRTTVTSASMIVSGASCIAAGLLFGASPLSLVPFLLVWGFVIVADSAQFSTCVTELADERYVGTALTLQTAIGFSLTTISIALVPVFADALGWRWAFAPFVIGPALGTLSMLRLRGLPAATKLAGGRR